MLRSKRIRKAWNTCRLMRPAGVVLLVISAGGCSADLGRFDSPAAGYGPSGSTNAIPIPSEPVRRNAGIPPDQGTSYESGPIEESDRRGGYDRRGYETQRGAGGDAYQGGRGYETDRRGGYGAPQPGYSDPQPGYSGGQRSYRDAQPGYGGPQSSYESAPTRTYGSQARADDRIASLPSPQREAEPRLSGAPEPASRDYTRATNSSPSALARSTAPGMRPAQTAASARGETIEVQPGDTLSSISRQYKVSVAELMQLNNLENPNLRPGQKIVVPAGKRPLTQRTAAAATASQPGAHIAPIGGRPQADSAPTHSLGVSTSASASGWRGTYTVGQGESLYGIARKHGVKVAELQQANGIADVTKIKPGTVLKVPGAGTQPMASTPVRTTESKSSVPALSQPVSSPLTVRPKIINGETTEATEPQRVASLGPSGQTATDAASAAGGKTERAGGPADTPKLAGTGKFRWPVKGKVIAGFGPRPDKSHNDGINISVPAGTEVLAAESGVVAYAGNELKGYGNLILIRHEGGWVSAYAHGDELLVKRGDKVRRGQPIAKAGNTGSVDQPQVHFELRQESKPVDPMPHMER